MGWKSENFMRISDLFSKGTLINSLEIGFRYLFLFLLLLLFIFRLKMAFGHVIRFTFDHCILNERNRTTYRHYRPTRSADIAVGLSLVKSFSTSWSWMLSTGRAFPQSRLSSGTQSSDGLSPSGSHLYVVCICACLSLSISFSICLCLSTKTPGQGSKKIVDFVCSTGSR